MTYRDYYKDLGVRSSATAAEIRKAYRTLAKKHHPDKNKGAKSAEERFKVISEAYEVLSDPAKRKTYDEFGRDWKNYQKAGASAEGFDWSRYQGNRPTRPAGAGSNESDAGFGDPGMNDLFEMLFGQRSASERRRTSYQEKGEELHARTVLTLEEAFRGTTRLIKLNDQTIKVSIKPGIADGQLLRIAGKGGVGSGGGSNGDLYLSVAIAPHPEVQRIGNDLHRDVFVELYDAVLGGKTSVRTLTGKVTVTIPKGAVNGQQLRLQGLGMPVYGKAGEYGDLLVTIGIVLPERLDEHELELFRALADHRKGRSTSSTAGP